MDFQITFASTQNGFLIWSSLVFPDENSNQSSLSDMYHPKVDSSSTSSPQPSEPVSPAHVSDYRADDPQPPTLGQESLAGETLKDLAGLVDD